VPLTKEVKCSIDESVLCWFATVSKGGLPNVSPKEMFIHHDDKLLIANIASPVSAKNVEENPAVCVSFIHIFKQKGFKLTGMARIVEKSDNEYHALEERLYSLGGRSFEIKSIFEVSITKISPIIAPSYWVFPETTEESQIDQARKSYGL